MTTSWISALREQLPRLALEEQVPLSEYTSFRIGGPAECMAFPASGEEMAALLRFAAERSLPYLLLGAGSNVLAPDEGLPGLVIQTRTGMQALHLRPDGTIEAQSGVPLARLASFAAQQGMTGLEFAQGIPGTVGGGVYMNAGAYGGELGHRIVSVTIAENGAVRRITGEDMRFGYRHSRAMDEGWIVLEARFRLEKGEQDRIDAAMRDFAARRREKQPLEYPSAGSFFKRPAGHFAGALIESAGLKGCSVGGAQVSEKHAGFLINAGGATAADFLALMKLVQEKVLAASGVMLEPEVRIVGEDP